MTVTAPKDGAEMLSLVKLGTQWKSGPFSIRWPRDSVPKEVPHISEVPEIKYGSWEVLRSGDDLAILATGTMVDIACQTGEMLSRESIGTEVVNCRFLKPYDKKMLQDIVRKHEKIIILEEGTIVNGFGASMVSEIFKLKSDYSGQVKCLGIPDRFIEHGPRDLLLREIGLDRDGVHKEALDMFVDGF